MFKFFNCLYQTQLVFMFLSSCSSVRVPQFVFLCFSVHVSQLLPQFVFSSVRVQLRSCSNVLSLVSLIHVQMFWPNFCIKLSKS